MYVGIGLAIVVAAGCSASPTTNHKKSSDEQVFTLFVTTELRGTIEPCGCNSDPLGDIARTAQLVTALRDSGRPVLVVDGGSLLYSETKISEHLAAQEALKSDLVHDIYTNTLRASGVGLGPYDLAAGPGKVRPPRQAANVSAGSGVPLETPKIVEVGKAKVGIFGVVSPDDMASYGVQASDPTAAARTAVASLRQQGAELIVALAHVTQAEAVTLAKAVPGIDIMVVGQNAPEPPQVRPGPRQEGNTFLIIPANRGQVVTRLDITLRGAGPLSDAIGEARASIEIASLGERIAKLESDLAAWKADPSADTAFVAARESELAELRKRRESLQASPVQAPRTGSYFTMTQIRIKKSLACDADVQSRKLAYDRAAGEANAKAAAGVKPPPPATGKPGFVGVDACASCHIEAVNFWKTTKHYQAWETIEKVGKELNYECISCHVTGWDKPGGSNLAFNQHLRDVQCETCHGPGSIHVQEEGDPEALTVTPAQDLCVTCHNAEHSDTFQYEAYLRDVTGPGHGEDFRKKLGDGPRGRELRAEALDKAGKDIGANCVK